MELTQNQLEHLQNLMSLGKITADQANVEQVKMQRVRLVMNKLPQQVRRALNDAVKSGELMHLKKDRHKPEAYFHPSFAHLAKAERRSHELSVLNAVKKVAGFPST
jgi:hypothetical protein